MGVRRGMCGGWQVPVPYGYSENPKYVKLANTLSKFKDCYTPLKLCKYQGRGLAYILSRSDANVRGFPAGEDSS